MEGGLRTAWPLKAHLLSKFPAFWWSLKHTHTHTVNLQTLSSLALTTLQRLTGLHCFSPLHDAFL